MNLPWVQQMGAVLPWRRTAPVYAVLLNKIQVGGAASVGSVSGQPFQISGFLQIIQRPFDRGAGQLQI